MKLKDSSLEKIISIPNIMPEPMKVKDLSEYRKGLLYNYMPQLFEKEEVINSSEKQYSKDKEVIQSSRKKTNNDESKVLKSRGKKSRKK